MLESKGKDIQENSLDNFIDVNDIFHSVMNSSGPDKEGKNNFEWEEDPIPYPDFVYSPDHINFPKYSARQMKLPEFLFDFKDPKNSFKNEHYLGLLNYGKGSGKDTICCHIILYLVYLLLCHKKPSSLFPGVSGESNLHIINMACDADQALVVFFSLMKNHILKWKWLKDKYYIYSSGTRLSSPLNLETEETVEIKSNSIIFPKGIHAESKHSGAEAIEGRNTIAAIIDEIAAFPLTGESNGLDLFNNVLSSSMTRFNTSFKLVAISYSRDAKDCLQRLIEEYRKNPATFIDVASTFEVKPRKCFGDKWVDWTDPISGIKYNIPQHYLLEFQRDPAMAKCKYLCIPPSTKDAWIVYEDAIHNSINRSRPQLFTCTETLKQGLNKDKYIFKTIDSITYFPQNYRQLVLSCDLSTTHDRAWLSLWGEIESGVSPRYHQLFFTNWYPSPKDQIRVPIQNVQDIITYICKKSSLHVSTVVFDSFESSQTVQNLNLNGINAIIKTQVAADFEAWRNSLYNGDFSFLDDADQIAEMIGLVNTNRRGTIIPDHKELCHDDSFRTNCAAYLALSGLLHKNRSNSNNNPLVSMVGGEIIQKFNPNSADLNMFGGDGINI